MDKLPVRLTRFIGRRGDLERLSSLIRVNRLLTLTGAGGCGKTRLALQFARDIESQSSDEIGDLRWVDLAQSSSGRSVAAAVADIFGLSCTRTFDPLYALRKHLSARAAFVVFDNCEHVLADCADTLHQLLIDCPKLRVLATSREPIGVDGETVWRVPSLPVPQRQEYSDFASCARYESVQLFADRAAYAQPTFKLDVENVAAVARICRQLDGIPLAIELAAGLIGALSPAEIAGTLHSGLAVSDTRDQSRLPRHRTLRASMDWSYALLSDAERTLLRRLAVFVGGFTREAAQEVCAKGAFREVDVLTALVRLVNKSLVMVEPFGTGYRYRLLEIVRQYAHEQLMASGEAVWLCDRHLFYFTTSLNELSQRLECANQPLLLDVFDIERANARTAMDWAIEHWHGGKEVLRLAAALTFYFNIRVDVSEGQRWFDDALRVGSAECSIERARVLWAAGYQAFTAGMRSENVQLALDMAREVGDVQTQCRAFCTLGSIDAVRHPQRSRVLLEKSIDLAKTVGDQWCITNALGFIAASWKLQSNIPGLRKWSALAHDAMQIRSNPSLEAWHWVRVSTLEFLCGNLSAAVNAARRGRVIAKEIGNPLCIGCCAMWQATAQCWRGHAEESLRDIETLEAREWVSARSPVAALFIDTSRGMCALATGRLDLAETHLRRAERFSTEADYVPVLVVCLVELAEVVWLLGRKAEAETILERAMQCAQALEDMRHISVIHAQRARLSVGIDNERAVQLSREALTLQRDHGYVLEQTRTLSLTIGLMIELGRHAVACELMGLRNATWKRMGVKARYAEAQADRLNLQRLRETFDDKKQHQAMDRGSAMSIDDAIALLVWTPGKRQRSLIGWSSLTPSELVIAELIAKGMTTREIAAHLAVSAGTVKTHLAHIFSKLGVARRSELAAEAVRQFPKHHATANVLR
ncbi:LuxR C-terminal-related transcriptional regulator [Trinickia sp. LjRoot230]|uniref:LuxR C-terminal-related transcriptional regulator n=1 Tax=Trinickia sp. LjRoot230 TaxID=3342288 RepID=UPI003ED153B0